MTERLLAVTVDMDTMAEDLGGASAESRPELVRASYEKALPRLLELLDRENIKATFFLVASHLEDPGCFSPARRIAEAGHEISSHGWSHDRLLPSRSP